MSLKEDLEKMRKDAASITPIFSQTGLPASISANNPLPIESSLPPEDYKQLLLDETKSTEDILKALCTLLIGDENILDHEWFKTKIKIDIEKFARYRHNIFIMQKRIHNVAEQIDMFPEDTNWYKTLTVCQKQQNENEVAMESCLLKIEDYLSALIPKVEMQNSVNIEPEEQMVLIDFKKINQMLNQFNNDKLTEKEANMTKKLIDNK